MANHFANSDHNMADNSSFLKAVRSGDTDAVVRFLDSGKVDVHVCNSNGLNALHLAAKDGYVDIVNELIRRKCVVDSKSKKGNTALHVASLAGQLEVVMLLIDHGADVNIQSQNSLLQARLHRDICYEGHKTDFFLKHKCFI
ncbi:hypothetical protein HELRODRAFT_169062 [Helobdella robusta]|uniref:Uncharacterized protein n=1 Tax=Helobdella robusta TaxID=6412 RepID=T1F1C6_HELRO|nr:hypothetical protein HELRODRAFT_169062 [Helobdella robusta]ESO09121.1 hypothetical protein HELRODRAFT_169062 [Helobdella robusta]